MVQNYNEAFNLALSAQQSQNWDDAILKYQKILDQSQIDNQPLTAEQTSAVSHNLSLIYLKKNEMPQAYIFNQKALGLNPRNSAALNFKNENSNIFSVVQTARDIPLTEQLNNLILKFIPIELLATFVVVSLYYFLKKLFQFFLDRKKSEVENTLPPRLPWTFYTATSLFLFLTAAFLLKLNLQNQILAIVKSEHAPARTSAGPEQPVINDLSLGSTVEILNQKTINSMEYIQIRVPGSFSGWVLKTDLELLNKTTWPIAKTKAIN